MTIPNRTTAVGSLLLAGLVLLCAGHPHSVRAHELPRERTLLVEITKETIEAMVVYREPPGRRVTLLFARHDLDGDKKLTGPEAEAAGTSWIPYALQGLEFRVGQETPERTNEEIKFRAEHNGAVSSAIYLSWDASELEPGADRRVVVSRASDAASFDTLVRFQVGSGLELQSAPGPIDDGATGPYNLRPGESVSVEAVRPASDGSSYDLPTRPP